MGHRSASTQRKNKRLAIAYRQRSRKILTYGKDGLCESTFVGINEPELKKANLPKGRDAKLPVYGFIPTTAGPPDLQEEQYASCVLCDLYGALLS